jgi:hypothetical protein
MVLSKLGLTLFEYSKETGWKLITWNEQLLKKEAN